MGRLTRDPELRHTQTGTAVASFSSGRGPGLQGPGHRRTDHRFHSMWLPGGRPASLSAATSPRAAWPWWRAASRSATGRTRTATSAARCRGGGRQRLFRRLQAGQREWRLCPPAQPRRLLPPLLAAAPVPPPPPSAAIGAPPAATGDQFAELSDDDGELPF